MNVSDIGEFGLIERLRQKVQQAGLSLQKEGFSLQIGIGDDAAVWKPGSGFGVCTTDTMVQGVHFTTESTSWEDVGWKAMASNLSDLAAMGASPLYALVTLGLPPATFLGDVDSLYDGALEVCRHFDTIIVGGDVVVSPVPFVTIALIGVCTHRPMTRSAALPGDVVAVVGSVGASEAGLRILRDRIQVHDKVSSVLLNAHRRPTPRLIEGRILAEAGILCALDVSDGLVDDLAKLCHASGVAAKLDVSAIPILHEIREVFADGYLDCVLGGGEDYALLCTCPPSTMTKVLELLPDGSTAVIGTVIRGEPGQVLIVDDKDHEITPRVRGWDHFKPT
jgi:thiamine-monophosphate kinase